MKKKKPSLFEQMFPELSKIPLEWLILGGICVVINLLFMIL